MPSFFKTHRAIDLLIVVFLVLLACVSTIALSLNFFTSTLLFFGLPSVYLVFRKPDILKKATVAAIVFGIIWGFSFNFIAEVNDAWDWTPSTGSVVPIHILGEVSGDVMVWYFLWVFLAIAFYEYFIDGARRKISKRALPIALVGIGVAVGLLTLWLLAPRLLIFPYTYLWLGVLALVPFVYVVRKDPKLFPKALSIAPFFVFLYLSCELVSLSQGLWSFPGQYLGTVTLLGISFPFEEFFFWIISSSVVAAAYYEFAVDDER